MRHILNQFLVKQNKTKQTTSSAAAAYIMRIALVCVDFYLFSPNIMIS